MLKPKRTKGLPLEERFQLKYVTGLSPSDCWTWLGAKTKHGYGVIRSSGELLYAHRISYEKHKGPIPDGLFVCHKCHNPGCLNPDHLYAGTSQENQLDRRKDGTSNTGERHGQSKLTEDQVREILTSDLRKCELVKKFNVSFELIGRIRRRDLWKHVDLR